MQGLKLVDFIYGLVEQLMMTTELNADETKRVLGSIREDLDGIRGHYQAPPPRGTEAVQELMLETLTLFDQSLDEISRFLDDQDEERLTRAISQSEEANDILSAIDELIENNKLVLSEMVEA